MLCWRIRDLSEVPAAEISGQILAARSQQLVKCALFTNWAGLEARGLEARGEPLLEWRVRCAPMVAVLCLRLLLLLRRSARIGLWLHCAGTPEPSNMICPYFFFKGLLIFFCLLP